MYEYEFNRNTRTQLGIFQSYSYYILMFLYRGVPIFQFPYPTFHIVMLHCTHVGLPKRKCHGDLSQGRNGQIGIPFFIVRRLNWRLPVEVLKLAESTQGHSNLGPMVASTLLSIYRTLKIESASFEAVRSGVV